MKRSCTVAADEHTDVRCRRIAPEGRPPLDYVAVPDSFTLPAGMTFGSTSGVAINSKGHIFVLQPRAAIR